MVRIELLHEGWTSSFPNPRRSEHLNGPISAITLAQPNQLTKISTFFEEGKQSSSDTPLHDQFFTSVFEDILLYFALLKISLS